MAWIIPTTNSGSSKWGFSCWQPILVYGKDPYLANRKGRRPDLIYCNSKAEKNGHPCPKPLKAWTQILNRVSAFEGDTILDPFMGSGTTGVTCVQTGRNFIGIEIDPNYFEIAKTRIEKAQSEMIQAELAL